MVKSIYFYKYICNAKNFDTNFINITVKAKSELDLIEKLKHKNIDMNRSAIYNLCRNKGKNLKYLGIDIKKIREPIPYRKRVVIEFLQPLPEHQEVF